MTSLLAKGKGKVEEFNNVPRAFIPITSLSRNVIFVIFFSLALVIGDGSIRAAFARTYWVTKSGTDTNPGTENEPFDSIQKAADVALAGDTVHVRAGIYNEQLVIKNSGTEGKPIIFEGEHGANGEWKTVIDGSVPVSGWVLAPEVGPDVYKTTDIRFNPYSITVNDKQLLRIKDEYMEREEGFGLLKQARDARVEAAYAGGVIGYWDGVEAIYGHRQGVTYIRFRNGDDPNGKTLRAAPNVNGIAITDRSNIVIRGFHVRGVYRDVVVEGAHAENNVIENNYLTHGYVRVSILNGAAHNLVANNEMTLKYYGFDNMGAWNGDKLDRLSAIRQHIYHEFKETTGPNPPGDFGVLVSESGEDNEIRNNHIFSGLVGVCCTTTRGVNVHHNVIHNMSNVGILTLNGVADGEFHDNLVFNCNINLRIHHYNTPKDNERREYHYRNLFYEPEGISSHIFVHYWDGGWPQDTKHPEIFIYQNSFAGGAAAIQPSAFALKSGGMARTRILNNIFSTPLLCRFCAEDFNSKEGMFDVFDCNWVGGSYIQGAPAWFGKNNLRAEGQRVWPSGNMPGFRLASDSPVRGKGVDLSKPFTVSGKTFDLLPGMKPGYFSGRAPDMGALQYGETSQLNSPTVHLESNGKGKSITVE